MYKKKIFFNKFFSVKLQVEPEELFKSLSTVESNLLASASPGGDWDWKHGWERPFTKDHPMLEEDVDKTILVPGKEGERGKMQFTWRLDFRLRDDYERIRALWVNQ